MQYKVSLQLYEMQGKTSETFPSPGDGELKEGERDAPQVQGKDVMLAGGCAVRFLLYLMIMS